MTHCSGTWCFRDLSLSCKLTDLVFSTQVPNSAGEQPHWFGWVSQRGPSTRIPKTEPAWLPKTGSRITLWSGFPFSQILPISVHFFYFDLFIHSDYPGYSTWTRSWHFDTLISSLTGKPTLIVSKTVRLLLKLLLATNLNACYQQGRKPANFMLKRVFAEWVFDLGN